MMLWLPVILLSLVVPSINSLDNADKICSSYGYKVVEAKFRGDVYILCLKLHKIGLSLTSSKSKLLLDPGPNDELVPHDFALDDVTMAYGFPIEGPTAGSAEGYIGDDHQFHGVLHIGNETLHADPHGYDDPTREFGVLENDHMTAPLRERRDNIQYNAGFDQTYLPFQIALNSQPGVARARICDLLLLADKEFFEKDGNSSLNHVIRRMLHAVAQADVIFRNADFNEDGIPDNIGFSVKYILILTSDETNSRVFGDIAKEPAVDGRNYLMRFARIRRLSEVCLGVAFSGHAFYNRTLGLSFTSLGGGMRGAAGGLCDRRAYGRSFNTLAIAHSATDAEGRVPERVAAITLAHEMGHSFGAHHDDSFPNPMCRGYIMSSQSSVAESRHNFEFSLCSKRLVSATLSSMSYCLADVDRPYCGNGIVEEGEACDCGLPIHCGVRDPCCTPRAGGILVFDDGALHRDGCSVAPTAQCHPSQGLCCTAECTYANLTRSGIDCNMQDQVCSCADMSPACRCGVGGRCLADGSCQAAECALLGLRECSCPSTRTGGSLKALKMCGVCCLFKREVDVEDTCLDVDIIAMELMGTSGLPQNWPDEYYRGPNMTLDLCNNTECRRVAVRAWPIGDVCVSLNSVGVCSLQATCQMLRSVPTSNVYPDVVKGIYSLKQLKNSADTRGTLNVFYLIMLLKF